MGAPFTSRADAARHYAEVSARLRGAPPPPSVVRRAALPTPPISGPPVAEGPADPYAAIGRLLVSIIVAVADDGRTRPNDVLRALEGLDPLRWPGPEVRPSTKLVIEVAAEVYGIPAEELRLSAKRVSGIAHARHMAMAAAVRLTHRSRHEISRHFRCDHSTVTTAFNRMEALMRESAAVASEMDRLEAEVRARHSAAGPSGRP